MTAEGWIQIAFDLSLLMALVFAVLAALVVPRRQHKKYTGRTFEDDRSLERGPVDPRKNFTPGV